MDSPSTVPVAVIGMSCRFPGGANDSSAFWSMLSEGRNGWSDVPTDRYNEKAFYGDNFQEQGTIHHRGGHFLDQDIRAFDAAFFRINSSEANAMDPQHRIQLECAYEAFESAGIRLEDAKGSNTAVYMATFSRDYERMMFKDTNDISMYHLTGVGEAILSNRISYIFDLKGPSMTLDTGCSGGLVALHQACQSLRNLEADTALVGGVNLILSPDPMIPMSRSNILNSDGRCYSFDTRGRGYGRGEGAAALLLKPLDTALKEGYCPRAIIRGTGVNQDGRTQGISVPSSIAQQSLIRSVYKSCGIDPRQVVYVEAHGTGTEVGDAAEMESIAEVFGRGREDNIPLLVGSVKSNIGHLESASGLAGMVKAILMLENSHIPPNYDIRTPRENAKWRELQIQVAASDMPWPKACGDQARFISVNSFGYGGTNAHCILESTSHSTSAIIPIAERTSIVSSISHRSGTEIQMDQREPIDQDLGNQDLNKTSFEGICYQIFPMTARSELSLQKLKHNISRWVSNNMQRDDILRDLAYTLNHGRSLHEYRHTLVVATVEDLQIGLDTDSYPLGPAGDLAQVEFVFTGQGAQWYAMGRQLIGRQSAFKTSLIASTGILRDLGACWDLLEELKLDSKRSRIARSEISQPSTTAIQIALVEVLQSIGIYPTTVMGHSSGEIAAAYAAGHLSHESALRVAFHRGLISQNIDIKSGPRGGMLAVGLNESQSRAVISSMDDAYLTIACANSPHNTTISGEQDAIARLKYLLDRKGVFNQILQVDLAYHSDLLKPATHNYEAALEGLKLRKPERLVKFISTVTGEYKDDGFGPSYWIQNLTSKVEFYAALRLLTGDEDEQSTNSAASQTQHILIEIGPHSALRSVISQTCKARQRPLSSAYLPTLIKGQHAVESILKLAASLFDIGVHVQLEDLTLSTNFDASSRFVQDLPPYPWDHSEKYWHESRLSIAHRCRQFPPHHLIGLPVLGSSPFQLMWSNKFSIQSHPWLEDHIIDSFVTLPGTSYLCMVHAATDQMCQNLPTSKKKLRYSFCDVSFLKALVFLEIDSEVELNLSLMRSQRHQISGLEGFWDFRIHSLNSEGQWSEHCQGSVNIEAFPILDGVEVFPEDQLQAAESEETFRRLCSSCKKDCNVQKLYEKLAEKGNAYGKSFALLQNVKTGHLNATGEIILPENMTDIVHPNVLDAIMHLVFPICTLSSSAASIVPVKVKTAFLSSEIPRQERLKLQVGTTILPRGPQVFNAETLVFAADDMSRSGPLLILKAEFQAIGDAADPAQSGDSDGLAWNIDWCPDVDFLEEGWLSSHCITWAQDQKISPEQKHLLLNRIAAEQISTCLEKLTNGRSEPQEPHLRRLVRWMEQFAATPEFKALRQGTSELPSCHPDCLGVEGEAVTKLGKAVGSIIKGEVNPLEKLLEQDLLFQLYDDDSSNICAQRLAEYVKLLAFKSPDLTILEVGAGTGATTLPILKAVAKSNLASFIRYEFTDISPSFFNAAEERLESWSDLITYRVLDIEGDPGKQGFQTGAYDLVIAANVLHATSSISTSLSNVRKLLKPGGRLALIELVVSVPYINFIAGTLPGWWKGYDEGRVDGPHFTLKQWDQALLDQEMTGVELIAPDFDGKANKADLVISRAIKESDSAPMHVVILKSYRDVQHSDDFTQKLECMMQAKDCVVSHALWETELFDEDVVYLVLDFASDPVLHGVSDSRFVHVKNLLTRSTNAFWAVLPGCEPQLQQYEAGLLEGIGRTARSENESLKLVTLDASSNVGTDLQTLAKVTTDVMLRTFGTRSDGDICEDVEFVFKDNMIIIPRLTFDAETNLLINPKAPRASAAQCLFRKEGRPQRLHVESPGLLASILFIEDLRLKEPLGANEIEVHAMAYGINFKDVFLALGQMPADTPMAGECAGVVTAVGSNLRTVYSPGDRVCALGATPYASQPRVSGLCAVSIPDDMAFTVAASVPVVFVTAYYSIVNVARLQKGQSILIHSAAGGVGQAALMIAQYIGADIFATVGSLAKRCEIEKRYSIPGTHIFSSRSSNFRKAIMRLTRGKGVDVALNSTAGQTLLDTLDCISTFGTFVEIGKRDIYRNSRIPLQPFDKNLTFSSVDLALVAQRTPTLVNDLLRKIFDLFKGGNLRPVNPVTTLPISSLVKAFRIVQAGDHVGKLVLESSEGSMVKAAPPEPDAVKLDHRGTYVIAGGLGALGLKTCDFMARHGAANIVILSRSTPDDRTRQSLNRLMALGTDVKHFECDITDSKQIETVASHCRMTLPPVRGVIQAAMSLQDVILEHMTGESFNTTVACKTVGTTNLFKLFGGPSLQFFIMLSSLASILGNRAQGNYAAGNAFLDHFAQMQNGDETVCYSINLGFIVDSETISAHQSRVDNVVKSGCLPLSIDQMLRVVGSAMERATRSVQRRRNVQLAIGFSGNSLARGNTKSIQRPMFGHLRHSERHGEVKSGASPKESVTEMLSKSNDRGELQVIVRGLIAQQVSSIMATKSSEMPLTTPLIELGLDSLAAVELKNWISKTLRVMLQTNEIMECNGIEQIADLVIQRSTLTSRRPGAHVGTARSNGEHESRVAETEGVTLAALPLPGLPDTLKLFKDSVAVFCCNEELQEPDRMIQNFGDPAGFGIRLQKELQKRAEDPSIKNWIYDLFTNSVYLRPRSPINPTHTFFGSHVDGSFQQSQAERAAILTTATLGFRSRLLSGELDQDFLRDRPLCMSSLHLMFNTVREPNIKLDKFQRYHDEDYLVVMRTGHYFKIHFGIENGPPLGGLIDTFQHICDLPLGPVPSVAALTATDRDSWAEARQKVQKSSSENDDLLRIIERAAFIVCLDQDSPANASERHVTYLYGDSANRWRDKTLQYVVCKNGSSAYVCDHVGLDSGTPGQLNRLLKEAILGYRRETATTELSNSRTGAYTSPAFSFTADPLFQQDIGEALQSYQLTRKQIEVSSYTFHGFGSQFLHSHRYAPKSGFQLMIQLASLRYFGHHTPSWEPVQLRTFLEGRSDMYQAVLPTVAQFCAAMQDSSSPKGREGVQDGGQTRLARKRELFDLAAKQHSSVLARVSRGHGFNHHLTAMRELAIRTEDIPSFLDAPIYHRIRPGKLMTDCAEWFGEIQDGGMAMPDPEFVWVHYEIQKDGCHFLLHGPAGKTGPFVERISEAGEQILQLFDIGSV